TAALRGDERAVGAAHHDPAVAGGAGVEVGAGGLPDQAPVVDPALEPVHRRRSEGEGVVQPHDLTVEELGGLVAGGEHHSARPQRVSLVGAEADAAPNGIVSYYPSPVVHR